MVRGSAIVAVIGCLLALAGCGGADERRADEAAAQRWVLAYGAQLDQWTRDARQTAAAAAAEDWPRLARIVRRVGRQGGAVRERFADVPESVADADTLYALLVEAGEAAAEWARVYRTAPPPYLSNDEGIARSRALSAAVEEFQRKANRAASAASGEPADAAA
jgi:hypothetical protein